MGVPSIVVQLENTLICSGIEPLLVPAGGAHVREAEIRVPATFVHRPTVSATVSARSGPGAIGVVFGIYNIQVNELGPGDTQIAIAATNVSKEGAPVKGDFVCDYVIIGLIK